MKKTRLLIFTVLALTSCFKKKLEVNSSKPLQMNQGIRPDDFINNLKIKIEIFNNDQNGYVSGEKQDHQEWFTDGDNNFEGKWISNSKIIGDWAFEYKFSFLEDGKLKLNLERFKVLSRNKGTEQPLLKRIAGPTTFIFKHNQSMSFKFDRTSTDYHIPIIAFTPILTKD